MQTKFFLLTLYSSGFSKLVGLRILVLHILVQQFTCGRARIDIPLLIDILWTGTHYVACRLCGYTHRGPRIVQGGSQIVHRGPRGPGKPPGNTSRRHRTSSFTGAKLALGVWCGTLVCVCVYHTLVRSGASRCRAPTLCGKGVTFLALSGPAQ